MEINHSSTGKSDQVAWSADDLQQGSGSHVGVGSGKSYTCSFCKRGFSNAQALGGHMNIHRRDRAKLKQASEENHQLLSLEISMTTPIDDPQAFEDKTSSSPLESLEGRSRSSTPKRPGSLSIEIEAGETSANKNSSQLGQQQLPFFEDSKRSITNPSGDDDGKKQTSRHGDSSQEAELLDLELRLGPEPHETSRRSRKGFF